jgi:hypothetical protein
MRETYKEIIMENNIDPTSIKSESFKHTLVKLAVATIAATIAKKAAETLVDHMLNRKSVATVEIVE